MRRKIERWAPSNSNQNGERTMENTATLDQLKCLLIPVLNRIETRRQNNDKKKGAKHAKRVNTQASD